MASAGIANNRDEGLRHFVAGVLHRLGSGSLPVPLIRISGMGGQSAPAAQQELTAYLQHMLEDTE